MSYGYIANDTGCAEFQKILTHPDLLGREVIGPLSRLQLARAQRTMGQDIAARASYEAFLSLWKNADAGIPAYRQAKLEYKALRTRNSPNGI